MTDKRSGEELGGVLSLGMLTEAAIRALGRLVRREPLAGGDERVIAAVARLFDRMAEEEVVVTRTTADQMLTDHSYLDALHVVELEAGGEIQERARRYSGLLARALAGDLDDDERDEVAALRDLLVSIGETTLSRANDLSRAYPEPSWRPALQATSRF